MKLKTDVGHMAKETGNEQRVLIPLDERNVTLEATSKPLASVKTDKNLASIVARESHTDCCKVWLDSRYKIF